MESKKARRITEDMLTDVHGGKNIEFGKWKFDVYCPWCHKDDMLHESIALYSDQSGSEVLVCYRCKRGFMIDQNGKISEIQVTFTEG